MVVIMDIFLVRKFLYCAQNWAVLSFPTASESNTVIDEEIMQALWNADLYTTPSI
jgi:hypothetical protein